MGLFTRDEEKQEEREAKRDARQDARAEKKDARQDARADKKHARQDARDDRQDARQEARADKQDARESYRDEKQDVRQDKRDDLKDARSSGAGRDELRDIRDDARDEKQDARDEKKDTVHQASTEKQTEVREANDDKRAAVDTANEDKKTAIDVAEAEKDEAIERAKLGVDWTNWIADYGVSDAETVKPRNARDLVDLVTRCVREGKSVRAHGAGHSTTSVARPDDVIVDPEHLRGPLPLQWLRRDVAHGADEHLVRVLSGTTVKELNRSILPAHDPPLSLPNMGSFDGQSVIGAISTGTHGSSVYGGPMADLVLSIELVTAIDVDGQPKVKMLRIEPTDGITDRAAFESAAGEHGMELLQNDSIFYAVVVSFGCMGLVYSVTLKVVTEFWLREVNVLMPWSEVKAALAEPTVRLPGSRVKLPPILVENDFVEFLVNAPAAQGKHRVDDPNCLVRFRNRVNPPRKATTWRDGHDWPPVRRKDSCVLRLGQALGRPMPDKDHDGLGKSIDHHFFEWTERKDPFEGGMEASVSHVVLRRERDDSRLGVAPEPPPAAISSELALPVERTAEAVDTLLDLMAKSNRFYTVPFGVRFVGPSRHILAPQFGRYTCMIETPLVLPNLKKVGRNYGELRKEMLPITKQMLFALEDALSYEPDTTVNARSHWGQYNELTVDRLRTQYDELDGWLRAYRRFNPYGLFDNAYTRQLSL